MILLSIDEVASRENVQPDNADFANCAKPYGENYNLIPTLFTLII